MKADQNEQCSDRPWSTLTYPSEFAILESVYCFGEFSTWKYSMLGVDYTVVHFAIGWIAFLWAKWIRNFRIHSLFLRISTWKYSMFGITQCHKQIASFDITHWYDMFPSKFSIIEFDYSICEFSTWKYLMFAVV